MQLNNQNSFFVKIFKSELQKPAKRPADLEGGPPQSRASMCTKTLEN